MGEGAHIVFLVLKYKTTGAAGWEDRINLRQRAEVDLGGEQMM